MTALPVLLALSLFAAGHILHKIGAWGVWEKSTLRVSPEVISLAISGDHLFAGTEGAGVFRSTDGGLTWEPFSRGLHQPQVPGLFVASRAGLVYAATPRGILRSRMDRSAWEELERAEDCSSITGIPNGPAPPVLLAFCGGDLLRSTDGDLWVQVPSPSQSPLVQLLPGPGHREALLLGSDGLWRTFDAALSWERVESIPSGDELDVIARSPTEPSLLVLGTFAPGVFGSRDGGRHWSALPPPPGRWDRIAISGAFLLAAGEGAVHRLRLSNQAAGERWETIAGQPKEWHNFLEPDPARPGAVYLGSPSGLALSRDSGRTWTPSGRGLEDAFAIKDIVRLGDRLFAITDHRTTLTSDGGKIWSAIGPRHSIPIADSLVVRASTPCQLLRNHIFSLEQSRDCGVTWTRAERLRVRDLTASGGDTPIVYALRNDDYTLLRSSDFGRTWQAVLAGRIWKIAVDPLDPDHVYVSGTVQSRTGIAETRDGGRSWRWIETPFPSGTRIEALVPSQRTPGDLLVGMGWGAWRYSPRSGWSSVYRWRGGARDLLEDPLRPGVLYVCSKDGVFGSEDAGRSWVPLRESVPGEHYEPCHRLFSTGNGSTLLMVSQAQVHHLRLRPGWQMAFWLLWQVLTAEGERDA